MDLVSNQPVVGNTQVINLETVQVSRIFKDFWDTFGTTYNSLMREGNNLVYFTGSTMFEYAPDLYLYIYTYLISRE